MKSIKNFVLLKYRLKNLSKSFKILIMQYMSQCFTVFTYISNCSYFRVNAIFLQKYLEIKKYTILSIISNIIAVIYKF